MYINIYFKFWEFLSKVCYVIFRFCIVFRFFWVFEICLNILLIYKWIDWMIFVLVRGFFLVFCFGFGIVCCDDKCKKVVFINSFFIIKDLLVGFFKNNVYVNKFFCLLYLVVLWVGSLCNVKGFLNFVLFCNLKI